MANIIDLENDCKCSMPVITPKNWDQSGADISRIWFISYRFYEPGFKPRKVIVKGSNAAKTLAERRAAIKDQLKNELHLLKNEAYNPRTRESKPHRPVDPDLDVSDITPLSMCLEWALTKLEVSDKTRPFIKQCLSTYNKAAGRLGIDRTAIRDVRKKDIRKLLDACGEIKKDKWTANNFNVHRAYLMMLYQVLCDYDLIDVNMVKSIGKKKTIKKIRPTLSIQDRAKVEKHLKEKYPNFLRFVQIFFHSGSRISELLRLKIKDVDLINQRYKVTIQKGKSPKEVYKVIKDIALPYWSELKGKPDDYVFSETLSPGAKMIRPEQVTRRWKRHVKDSIGVEGSLYSLKHSHTTEVVDLLGEIEAAQHNSHTSTDMVKNVYDVKNKSRLEERVKSMKNKFS